MTINSFAFIAFLAAALVLFHLAPGWWRARVVFPLLNLVFMALIMPGLASFAAVLCFVVMIWLASRVIVRHPARGGMIAVLGFVLLLFGWLKAYAFLSFMPFAGIVPATVGLSYMLIRALQLLADLREAPKLRPDAISLFTFLTAWPCLVSGPVQRFQDFEAQRDGMASFRLTDDLWHEALRRMLRGWLWVLVLGDVSKHAWLVLKGIAFQGAHPLALGGAELFFLVHLFFDFAGYTNVVMGAGLLFGMRLPENFNRPFESRSFLDFWSRWHMSMSGWFKVYVFNPLLMELTRRWPSQSAAPWIGSLAFFITFFLVGLWHGTTVSFVICGLLLGIGASANQWYRALLRARLGKKRFDALGTRWPHRLTATGLAFSYVCLSIAPLWMSTAEMHRLVFGYGLGGLFLAHAGLAVICMLLFAWSWPRLPEPEGRVWQCFKLALQVVVIELYLFLFPSFGGAFFYEQF